MKMQIRNVNEGSVINLDINLHFIVSINIRK